MTPRSASVQLDQPELGESGAGEEQPFRPRVRVIAINDEAGQPREAVQRPCPRERQQRHKEGDGAAELDGQRPQVRVVLVARDVPDVDPLPRAQHPVPELGGERVPPELRRLRLVEARDVDVGLERLLAPVVHAQADADHDDKRRRDARKEQADGAAERRRREALHALVLRALVQHLERAPRQRVPGDDEEEGDHGGAGHEQPQEGQLDDPAVLRAAAEAGLDVRVVDGAEVADVDEEGGQAAHAVEPGRRRHLAAVLLRAEEAGQEHVGDLAVEERARERAEGAQREGRQGGRHGVG